MPAQAQLVLITDDGNEQFFPLSKPQITLGRNEDNDIILVDSKVSRVHAQIESKDGAYILVDMESGNGTLVNGQRVDRVTLKPGNRIRIANHKLRFEQNPTAPSEAPAKTSPKRPRSRAAGTEDRHVIGQLLDSLQSGDTSSNLRDLLFRMPRMTIYTPEKTWELRLKDQESWTIGRAVDNDIVIDHQKVSRYHARIERQQDSFIIRDLNSVNGTRLGNQSVQSHTMRHADTFNVGNAQLLFKDANQVDEGLETFVSQPGRKPIVVVPGLFGSNLYRQEQKIWPNVRTIVTNPEYFRVSPDNHIEPRGILDEFTVVPKLVEIESYSRIHDYLDNTLGYTVGKDLIEFAYDWRDDIRLASQKLAETIEAWNIAEPATIIAHSMGCLVSRYYIDQLGGDKHIDKLILMGGPNYGSINPVVTVHPDDLIRLYSLIGSLGIGRKIKEVYASFPVQYQMLPTYPCVVDQHGRPIDLFKDRSWLSAEQQEMLQLSYDFNKALSRTATIPTVSVFGYGQQTPTQLKVERDDKGRWLSAEISNTSEGDGQIPSQSAILQGSEIHPVQQDHNQLYIDEDVMMRLKYELMA